MKLNFKYYPKLDQEQLKIIEEIISLKIIFINQVKR